jgi:hypothetical protein
VNDLSPKARSILDAGRHGDDPSPADRARVRKALSRALAAGGAIGATAAAGGAAAAGKPLVLWTLGKVLSVIAVLGCVAAGVAITPWQPRAASTPPAPSSPLPADPAPAIAMPAPSAAPALEAGEAPAREPPPSAPAPARPQTPPAAAPPSAGPDTLVDETKRLREVQGALKDGDAERALELLDAQSAEYGKGALGEERAAARVIALCKAGRAAEAEAARERFLRESPRSPLADRVRAECARP